MDTKLGYMRLPLEVHGIAQRRVPARRVVEALDIIEHVGLRVIARSICLPADPFGLHRREEALHCGVVPDVTRLAHRAGDAIPVTGMALAVSAAIVISMRPEPLGGLLYGAGLGVLGEGIFKIAEKYLQKAGTVFGVETDKPAA